MTDAKLATRAEKNDYRRAVSLEHAKTRGMTVAAFQNTLKLRTYLRRTWIGGGVALVAVVAALILLFLR